MGEDANRQRRGRGRQGRAVHLRVVRGTGGGRPAAGARPGTMGQGLPPVRHGGVWRWLALAALGAAVGLGMLTAAVGWMRSPGPVAAEVREVRTPLGWSGRALFIRDEEVYVAPVAGRLTFLVDEGVHVRAGERVARVDPPVGEPLWLEAGGPGTVSYRVDGLETLLVPARLPWLDGREVPDPPGPDWLRRLRQDAPAAPGPEVAGGTPVYKVVSPQTLWLAALLPDPGPAGEPHPLQRVEVSLPGSAGGPVPFQVTYRSQAAGGEMMAVFRSAGPWPGEWTLPRWQEVNVVWGERSGWAVPRAAVDRSRVQPVVRRLRNGRAEVIPVTVLAEEEDVLVVAADLKPGDRVLLGGAARR